MGEKSVKFCGDKLIKNVLIKQTIKFNIVSIVTDIMFLKKDFNVIKSTFYRKISKFRNTNIFLPEDRQQYNQIFVDTLWLKRKCCYLIARTSENVIGFARCDSECFESWLDFLKKFKPPKYVICDGQNGLLKQSIKLKLKH